MDLYRRWIKHLILLLSVFVISLYDTKTHSCTGQQSLTHIKTQSCTGQSLTHIKTHSCTGQQSLQHTPSALLLRSAAYVCTSSVPTKKEKNYLRLQSLSNASQKSPTGGPSGCITRPAASFAHYAFTTNRTHKIILLTAGFRRAVREPTHNTVWHCAIKFWRPLKTGRRP